MRATPSLRLLLLGLPLLLACGGAPSRLAYTDPPAGGYRLVAATADQGRLVLDLVGPAGARIQGGTFSFHADGAKVDWGLGVRVGEALDLGREPRLLKSEVEGSRLRVGLYQKQAATTLGDRPLLSITLEARPGATGPVQLGAGEARILDASGAIQQVPVHTGTLQLVAR